MRVIGCKFYGLYGVVRLPGVQTASENCRRYGCGIGTPLLNLKGAATDAPADRVSLSATEEDGSFLSDPSKHKNILDSVKYIPLLRVGCSLTLGDKERIVYEN